VRERIMVAMLETCGAKGYRLTRVQDVIERYGGHRAQFYSHFASKADCYAAAYRFEIERRYTDLRDDAARASSWQAALRVVLEGIARFVVEQPLRARALVVEAHVADEDVLLKRTEVIERVTTAMDGARLEVASGQSAPPVTATFMIGVIETAVTRALIRGEPKEFAAMVAELGDLVQAAYEGEDHRAGNGARRPDSALQTG
jgi:AcrR family transcriptional regulator